jgi:hypothetical protein
LIEVARSHWPLRTLTLHGEHVTATGLAALVASPLFAGIRDLELRMTGAGDEGVRLIAECARSAGLRSLTLAHCGVGDAGAKALVNSPNLGSLNLLAFEKDVAIRPKARSALEERFGIYTSEGRGVRFDD